MAVNRIIGAKYGSCAGQACVSVDYLLVEKAFSSAVVRQLESILFILLLIAMLLLNSVYPVFFQVELMKVLIKKMYGDNPRESQSVGRIVNKRHFLRLKNLLTDKMVKDSIVYGGSMDEDSL